ncbi:peptidyl-tRNA hydrolase [Streptomyces sp. TRM 70361]|uniref:peptidyl-tRNA hydrolase n=1 Tax=Streptomyces sp. TRM 70361 TaxID=3116553 RepID=UPI002E7C384E|nr:peptidyl-tRNA hydrolase [Streptomyces sp. TRM 70361]MEE1941108.1 peptidyl-tRNA hydrolase [Streptomyces sp. TRM 70361]
MTTPDAPSPAASDPAPADPAPADRDAAPQYVLPLVVRIERATPPGPPARADALGTAARAVLALLSDERATDPGGDWHRLVRAWQDGRIRKVVRRARGAEWRRVQALPGITVTGPGAEGSVDAGGTAPAEVRVFPPVPLDGWPKELARLQVSGTELTDPAPPVVPASGTPVLWLNPALEMSAGKAMAQAGHGAQFTWWALDDDTRAAWRAAGFPLAVRTAPPGRWAELTASGLPVVRDAGFTEIAPGSATVVADHPALRR